MCAVDDAEGWKLFRDAERKARKPHQCCECGRTIAVGETYYWATGLSYDDGMWDSFHQCAHCAAASHWLTVACSGYLFYGVLEDLEDHWEESSELRSITLARLIAGMRHKWCDGRAPIPDKATVAASVPTQARSAA